MTAQSLVYAHLRARGLRHPEQPVPDGPCWLCGEPTGGAGTPRDAVITAAFSQGTDARAPMSTALCTPCAWSLSGKPGSDPAPARMQGHVVGPSDYRTPTRSQWRDELLQGLPSLGCPFAVVIPTSAQKHLLYKAPLNWSLERYAVQFEDVTLHLAAADLHEALEAFEALYAEGFAREEIRTGRYPLSRCLALGPPRWLAMDIRARPWRGSPLWEIVAYIAQRKEAAP